MVSGAQFLPYKNYANPSQWPLPWALNLFLGRAGAKAAISARSTGTIEDAGGQLCPRARGERANQPGRAIPWLEKPARPRRLNVAPFVLCVFPRESRGREEDARLGTSLVAPRLEPGLRSCGLAMGRPFPAALRVSRIEHARPVRRPQNRPKSSVCFAVRHALHPGRVSPPGRQDVPVPAP